MNESLRKKIEQRAYELFLKRGGLHGYHLQDWAQAEKEVLGAEGGKKTAPVAVEQPKKVNAPVKPEAVAAVVKKPQTSKKR